MPQNYSGTPANITTPLSRTVAGCTAGTAGRVRVATTVAHLFGANDVVRITGVVGTTEANVVAPVNVIDATHFDLVGTTFVNAYVSGGTVSDRSITPYFQMPSDGEQGTVASIEAAIQAVADRTAWLRSAGLIATLGNQQSGTYGQQITGSSGSTAWVDSPLAVTFTKECLAGDRLMIVGQARAWILSSGSGSTMQTRITVNDGGTDVPLPETLFQTKVTGASGPPTEVPGAAFATRYVVVNAGTIIVKAQVRLSVDGGGGDTANLAGPASLSVELARNLFI